MQENANKVSKCSIGKMMPDEYIYIIYTYQFYTQ